MAQMLTGAQILWECLLREGVETVFGYPGGAILPAYDAMLDYPIRHVLVRHEQGAAHMADGYARASGKVGVAVATSGPGATNLTTGIREAFVIAKSGRPGPVLVDICKDAQQAKTEFVWPEKVELPGLEEAAPPDPKALARAVELIAAAERPLILAGHGVVKSGASE